MQIVATKIWTGLVIDSRDFYWGTRGIFRARRSVASTPRGGEEPFLLYVRGEKLFGYASTRFLQFLFFAFLSFTKRGSMVKDSNSGE